MHQKSYTIRYLQNSTNLPSKLRQGLNIQIALKKNLYLIPIVTLIISATVYAQSISDDDVRAMIIKESIASYPGNCPCPYNLAKNGSKCGKRSAWSKPGGYEPLCYVTDISEKMVQQYRQRHSISDFNN